MATTIHDDGRCCGARAARRSRCRRWRSCSTATASYAQATPIPKRYVVCFGGQSLGGDGDPLHNDYVPNTVGANYDLKSALAPLAPVQGRGQRGVGPVHPDRERRRGARRRAARRLPRLVAEPAAVGRALARRHRVGGADVGSARRRRHRRQHAVQVAGLPRAGRSGTCACRRPTAATSISYKANPAGGNPLAIQPVVSPQTAFDALFNNFTPPNDARGRAPSRTSCCAAARACSTWWADNLQSADRRPELGTADQQRLSRHFDEIRDLERQISAVPPPATAHLPEACPIPGADPALGRQPGRRRRRRQHLHAPTSATAARKSARKIFCDLVHMALTCDLTARRVAACSRCSSRT